MIVGNFIRRWILVNENRNYEKTFSIINLLTVAK